MPHWLVWVIAAGVLAVGEMFTLTLILGPIALAAVVAAGVAAVGGGLVTQFAAFGAASLVALFALRPIARRHLRTPHAGRTGVAALTGQAATVIDAVGPAGGTIKLAGEVWTARPLDPGRTIPPGAEVTVVEIAGATAVVMES